MNQTLTSAATNLTNLGSLTPYVQAVLRIGAGLLFIPHGAQKLFGVMGGAGGSGATVELFSQLGLAGVLEFFGGMLIVMGLFTRPVAFVLTLLMIAAYIIGHAPQGTIPVLNGGELALLFALIFAYFTVAGPGHWSMDRRLFPRIS
jgi:putative oxidoreductase